MIDHVWRERLALSDRLIALRPSAMPFALACRIEALRRSAIAAAKALRDRLRAPLKSPSNLAATRRTAYQR